MSCNSSFENAINVMKIENPKDYAKLDMAFISQYKYLSEEFIETHFDRLSMRCISNHQKLSEKFIEKHINELDMNIVIRKKGIQNFSEKFVKKYYKNITALKNNNMKRHSSKRISRVSSETETLVNCGTSWRKNENDTVKPALQRVKTYSNLPMEIPLKPTAGFKDTVVKTFDYHSPNQYNFLKEDFENSVKIEDQYDFLKYDYSLIGKKILDTYCQEDYFKSRYFS